jgi:hypothetical protein
MKRVGGGKNRRGGEQRLVGLTITLKYVLGSGGAEIWVGVLITEKTAPTVEKQSQKKWVNGASKEWGEGGTGISRTKD